MRNIITKTIVSDEPTLSDLASHLFGRHKWRMSWINIGMGQEKGEEMYDTCLVCGKERYREDLVN